MSNSLIVSGMRKMVEPDGQGIGGEVRQKIGVSLENRVLSVSLRKPVSIRISFLPAAAEPMSGLFQAAAQSPIC